MNNNKRISIIVPVYNVDQYLCQCIDSILNQEHKNLEIILVNDGSTDNSAIICDDYLKKDDRIIVVHKKNEGLSSARNHGVSVATGEYIGFVDSDDYIHPLMYKTLLYYMDSNFAQIAECRSFSVIGMNKLLDFKDMDFHIVLNGQEALKRLISPFKSRLKPRYAVWSKLFKAEIIKDLLFPHGMIHEDHFYDTLAFLRADKYVIISKALYYHRFRENSIMTSRFNKSDFSKLILVKERTQYLRKNGYTKLADLSKKHENIIKLKYYYFCSISNLKEEAKMLEIELNMDKFRNLFLFVPIKLRLKFILYFFSPFLYILSYSFKSRILSIISFHQKKGKFLMV